ncbi:SDR family oxidoreductase [Pseudoalteromonas luteoviolacea]|uniref:Short-chain dehydrogenase n=1 Tax=Pseudoalteromonas luteoviolacea S4054 TaxID=1129367 RepID=A0A0F6AHA6_9GAMM|nr:SDR family oxidoreductase [Pseudoalteromonas luteoviolacea]AOT08412.1 short-chain dehydrogenase [Pseudoalteromonas luteoviolacea]AOT13328.1 short-chain dehydrogenase [Pseudoalteromonas luteoviolacea]AOT18241.1 short-chain dehydrogenase [Pseudoalteromonas luteoviolacea]KKE84774.1 short-chain dehydrogenase [Pseudoalteromonas luteoviolacea S4054]KZN76033.1 short-chain dehydrogenase [Pseudoalteromonas luteoviolacea S4047-1]
MSKSILITGCSTGIGLYCAKTLYKSGYKVIASVRDPKHRSQFEKLNIPCILLDLADDASINQGFQQALDLCDGKLDILFNNGAYGQPGAVEDLPTEVLRQQFEVNFFGWHTLTRLAVAHMRVQGQGRIIQNSSVLGLVALPYRGAYNASKFALEGLTDTLRMELVDTNIQISLIEPGPILSDFRKNARQAFEQHIDIESSHHKDEYQAQLTRLKAQTAPQKFTLGPEAVYDKLIHAIEAPNAKARYYVTFPTYLMGYLKRILSTNWLDKLLLKNP